MTKTIQLSRGYVTVVDDEDYEYLSEMAWHITKGGYARHSIRIREGVCRALVMHRYIMDAQPGEQVDHRDGDKLNNTRSNLRITDRTGNARNKGKLQTRQTWSRFKGVSFNTASDKWVSYINSGPSRTFLGFFNREKDAALAYNDAAQELHGDFARLNNVADDGRREDRAKPRAISPEQREELIAKYNAELEERGLEWGECFCGCGEQAPKASQTAVANGNLESMPLRYIQRHVPPERYAGYVNPSPEEHKAMWCERFPETPYGFCACGCGQRTTIPKRNRKGRDNYPGLPCWYLPGHGHAERWRSE